jgi:hypothetical protein
MPAVQARAQLQTQPAWVPAIPVAWVLVRAREQIQVWAPALERVRAHPVPAQVARVLALAQVAEQTAAPVRVAPAVDQAVPVVDPVVQVLALARVVDPARVAPTVVPVAALVLVAVVPVVDRAAVPVADNNVCIKQALWSCIV